MAMVLCAELVAAAALELAAETLPGLALIRGQCFKVFVQVLLQATTAVGLATAIARSESACQRRGATYQIA
jgi:hypothetical protein